MKTYSVSNEAKIHSVIKLIRNESETAFSETHNNKTVLCTTADVGLIAMCSGDGTWATFLFNGLPH